MSRSKRLLGSLTRPRFLWPPKGGRSAPQIHLFQAPIFLLLPLDVVPYHLGVPSNRGYEVPSRPEVLTYEVAFSLSVHASQMDRAFALDEPDHLRHGVFRRDRDQHVHVIGQKMAFLDPTFLLLSQLSEHFSEMPSQLNVQRLPAELGNENNVIFALPLAVA